jgi:hypothetical protein
MGQLQDGEEYGKNNKVVLEALLITVMTLHKHIHHFG